MPPIVHIPTHCKENWEGMTLDGPGRFCDRCQTTVHDLTVMGPGQADRFIKVLPARLADGEHLCVRAHTGPDGRLVPTSLSRRLLNNGMAAMLAMTFAGYAGSGPSLSAADGPVGPTVQCPTTTDTAVAGGVMFLPEMGDVAIAPSATPAAISATAPIPVMGDPIPSPTMGRVISPAVSTSAPALLMGKPAIMPPTKP